MKEYDICLHFPLKQNVVRCAINRKNKWYYVLIREMRNLRFPKEYVIVALTKKESTREGR